MLNPSPVPFFSQWETPDLTMAVLEHGPSTALLQDLNWKSSGANTIDEYAEWAAHICGMACLKMILAAKTGQIIPNLDLARACTKYGGYEIDADGTIKGLIYAPFVEFIRNDFGIKGSVITNITAYDIKTLMLGSVFFIASVHPGLRWPNIDPPRKGGHLVLVTRAHNGNIIFHNPSGDRKETQENASLSEADFDRFFSGRGVSISPILSPYGNHLT
jgi:hypothetical protein